MRFDEMDIIAFCGLAHPPYGGVLLPIATFFLRPERGCGVVFPVEKIVPFAVSFNPDNYVCVTIPSL